MCVKFQVTKYNLSIAYCIIMTGMVFQDLNRIFDKVYMYQGKSLEQSIFFSSEDLNIVYGNIYSTPCLE